MVRLKNLSKTYLLGNKPVEALKDISFEIPPHQFVSILGKSGSGKSSLLNLIAGLDQPTQGEIWVGEQSLATRTRSELAHYRSHSIGIVFQSFHLVSHRSAFQNVELPLNFSRGLSKRASKTSGGKFRRSRACSPDVP
jgi:ABC-type lipoprotein export system ATPase subunit